MDNPNRVMANVSSEEESASEEGTE
jgi:hypothetical protein